ncbi:MAG: NDP-sugar synthase [Dehalococcoidia bacterium]|nr:NDP-sugar synthase [Dehalococcoidia bacterium]
MKAVVLVGGEGTRLRPLTCNIPKPMVPIANRPFLESMIEQLKSHGIDDIILCMGYMPDKIRSYFGDGRDFGVKMTYVVENSPLGTAGAVKNVEELLDGTCFVFNADIITDLDLTSMLRFHRENCAKVTIALTPVDDPTSYGIVETEAVGRVRRFLEKPGWDEVTTNMINAGTYIIEPEVLKLVPQGVFYMFERGLFPALLQGGESVFGYPSSSYWIDIGTPQRYLAVHHDLLLGKLASKFPGVRHSDGVWAGEGVRIDPTAKVAGPVIFGRGCIVGGNAHITGPTVVGDNCEIGDGATVEESVVWRDTKIGPHATVKGSMLGEGVCVAEGVCLIGGVVIGDGARIGAGNSLEHGARIWPGKVIEEGTVTF